VIFAVKIAHTILSHLNFADMKAARQVSHTFLEMVENCMRFRDAKVLRVAKEKCPMGELNFILNTGRIWRGIRIDVPIKWTKNSLTLISRVLENIEFLSLRIDTSLGSDDYCCDIHVLECIVSFIRDILSSTRNMKHLQIEAKLFVINLSSVFECSDVQENLKTLQRLDITDKNNSTGIHSKAYTFEFWYPRGKTWTVRCFTNCLTDNLIFLGPILHRVQSFGIANGSFVDENEGYYGTMNPLQSALVEFLQANRESLNELSIHSEAWDDKGVNGVALPRLRSLTAAASVEGQDRLNDFLVNHPTLEELDVDVEEEFLTSLLDVIKLRSANLRKLHLNAVKFVKVLGRREVKVDWRFLGEMTRLEDFQLARPVWRNRNWEKYGNGTRFLECLPQNQLETLSLEGIGARDYGFWRVRDLLGQYIDIELTSKLELLGGFRNLKRLSLRRCPDAVDDKIMQFIVKEMTSLEELEVTHCSQLTDVGFAGTSGDGSDAIRIFEI